MDKKPYNEAMMKVPIHRTLSFLTCLLTGCGLMGFALAAGQIAANEPPAWYLLEIADERPPCIDTPADARCVGTRPRMSIFELRDGERIDMPATYPLPPAWVTLNRMWVYAPAVADEAHQRSIQLDATPMGARVIVRDGERHYLQSVALSRWTALEAPQRATLWVRVTPSVD